jgi:hypothetical protein
MYRTTFAVKCPVPRNRPPLPSSRPPAAPPRPWPSGLVAWATDHDGRWVRLPPDGCDVGFAHLVLLLATRAGLIPRNAEWAVAPAGVSPEDAIAAAERSGWVEVWAAAVSSRR